MEEIIRIFEECLLKNSFATNEKHLKSLLKTQPYSEKKHSIVTNKIFELAKSTLKEDNKNLIDRLAKAIRLLNDSFRKEEINNVYFSPGDECLNAILQQLEKIQSSIKICVFTISDDRIARKLSELQSNKKHIKIITDNEKLHDVGSDIQNLVKAGIPVKIDRTSHHMHHKFAVVDNKIAITGSYNWTRSAEAYNQENILITNNEGVVKQYLKEFDKLWSESEDY